MATKLIRPEDYSHSPIHYAVAIGDHKTLTKLISNLPKLSNPSQITTLKQSISQQKVSDEISLMLDRRDNPHRETPLHLAVRINDCFSAGKLAGAGADISLQNSNGWNALQESICRKCNEITRILIQQHHLSAWLKWRMRLPQLISVLERMRDFYMEISFHFESSIVPFVGKIAPSDTYRIWKRDANLRADTSLAGYDGLKIQRANQSFLFLGESGSLLVINHDDRKIFDAFETAGSPLSESDISNFLSQTSVYRPGMDVTKAELITKTNWRKQAKIEHVHDWKARVYEINNVVFTFKSRKITSNENDFINENSQILPLELEDDSDEEFLRFSISDNHNHNHNHNHDYNRRHSSFVPQEKEFMRNPRKSVDVRLHAPPVMVVPSQTKEKEFVKSLKPVVWLTEDFPLKTEELLPLLDILANKVKAVRRMREVLTTKFPAGTFPVKMAIPVVPTVRVVITFTKFVELEPTEQFYTPPSSPTNFGNGKGCEEEKDNFTSSSSSSSSSSYSWLPRSGNKSSGTGKQCLGPELSDPFAIPTGYSWSSFDDRSKKMKKSKSTRKAK